MGRAARWLALLAFTGSAFAQTVLTFHSDVDASEQPYAVYFPKAFESGKKYPLLVSLHAEESNHTVNLRQVFGVANRLGDVAAGDLRNFPAQADLIVACPWLAAPWDTRASPNGTFTTCWRTWNAATPWTAIASISPAFRWAAAARSGWP